MKKWIDNAEIVNDLSALPKVGEKYRDRGLCISVELYEDKEEYVIYHVFFLIGRYIDTDTDIAYWSYAIKRDNIKG